jgi:Zn-dependent protease
MDISADQVRTAIVSLIAFLLSVAVHEFGHAWMANRLGDRLPAQQGRLTLSPLKHYDLIGTILMPLLGAFAGFPLIAWGKPVQTNPMAYDTRRLSRRTGHMLVSLMGPLMNLVLAVLISVALLATARLGVLPASMGEAGIRYFVQLNLILMFFNLIPIAPLDGVSVLAGILPESLQFIARFLQKYGMILFFALLVSGKLQVLLAPAIQVSRAWADVLRRLMAG